MIEHVVILLDNEDSRVDNVYDCIQPIIGIKSTRICSALDYRIDDLKFGLDVMMIDVSQKSLGSSSAGSIARTISHLTQWQWLIESNIEALVILEDDVELANDYLEQIERYSKGKNSIDFVNLCGKGNCVLSGYLISKKAAEEMLFSFRVSGITDSLESMVTNHLTSAKISTKTIDIVSSRKDIESIVEKSPRIDQVLEFRHLEERFISQNIEPVWFWSGNQKFESREVEIETICNKNLASMKFVESAPSRGDVCKMLKQIRLPDHWSKGFELRFEVSSHYHNPSYSGRIQYEILLNDKQILCEDITMWNLPNLISIKDSMIPDDRLINIAVILKCIGNCEPWNWGEASEIRISSIQMARSRQVSGLNVACTSPYSNTQDKVYDGNENTSFADLMNTRRLEIKHKTAEWNLMSILDDKLKSYSLMDKLQVRRPMLYGIFDSLDDVPFELLPENFILKPYQGDNNWGVFCLTKVSEGYYDSMRGKPLNIENLKETYENERARAPAMSETCFCEEVVEGRVGAGLIPLDYKFYCFGGKMKMLLIRDTNGGSEVSQRRFRFFDDELKVINGISKDLKDSEKIDLPENIDDLIKVTEKISSFLPLPFIRIDLFNSTNGPVFGEFTVDCGTVDKYTSTWDKILGEAYLEAQKNLSTRIPNLSKYIEESGLLSLGMPTILDTSDSD